MKYLLLIYSPESAWTDETRSACMVESMGIGLELAQQGKYITSAPLQFVATAKTVRVVADEVVHTTGPFMETIEQLGGFYLLDLPDLDEAIQVACRLPPAKKGTVEVRPIRESEPACDSIAPSIDLGQLDQPAYLLMQYGGTSETIANLEHSQLLAQLSLCSALSATSAQVRGITRQIRDGACDEASEKLSQILIVKSSNDESALKDATILAKKFGGDWETRPLFDLRPIAAQIS